MSTSQNPRRSFAAALAVAALPGAAMAHPQGREGMPQRMHERMGEGMRERMHGRMQDPAMQERMLERRTSHMLDAVQATPEQRSRIMGIAKAMQRDLAPIKAQLRDSRSKGRELMFAATLDPAALEAQRQAQMKLRDAIGRRTLQGMTEGLALLSAEQRATLAKRVPQRSA